MRRFVLASFLLCLGQSSLVQAEDSVQDWMNRMSTAVERTSYQGTFIRVHDGKMETLEIFHRVDEAGQVTERLVSLDGAGREIVRDSKQVRCFLPDKRSVLVERTNPGMSTLSGIPRFAANLDNYVVLDCDHCDSTASSHTDVAADQCALCTTGEAEGRRMLAMDTVILAITPTDQYRYGYRIWLDRKSALPLQTQVLDEQGQVIEQIRFTRLQTDQPVPVSAVMPGLEAKDFEWFYQDPAPTTGAQAERWRATSLPPGFVLTRTVADLPQPATQADEHLVFSDGLASISVFVESGPNPGLVLGLSRLGGANAFSVRAGSHYVTAVGEVPPAAVEMLARSMRPLSSPDN